MMSDQVWTLLLVWQEASLRDRSGGGEETKGRTSPAETKSRPHPPLTLCRVEGLEARERLLIGVVGAEGDFQAGARRAEGVVAGRALRVRALRAAERGQFLGPGAQLGRGGGSRGAKARRQA